MSPCKDCENRVVGCHSNCDLYIEWSSTRNETINIIKKEKQKELNIGIFKKTCVEKTKKKLRH